MGKKKKKKNNGFYFDYGLLFFLVFILGFGLLMIYSTSAYTAQIKFGDAGHFFKKELLCVGLGIIGMFVTARVIDYHWYKKMAMPIFVVSLLLVLLIIPFGIEANGAKRWLGYGSFSFQPAEVVKLAVIISGAAMICRIGTNIKRFRFVVLMCVIIGGIPAAMLYIITNNLSSAIIVFAIEVVITFVAYPGYKIYVAATALFGAVFAGFYSYLVNMIKTGKTPKGFRMNRFLIWLNPEEYIDGKGYQTVQALYAIGSGGLFGKGLGKSLQKLGFIPESQNDMIFSVICEELGLFGAALVILLFGLMLWRIVHIAQNAPDLFGTLLATGVFAHIAIQVVLNIAVVTNLIPNTGVSLPFISYGGTSVIFLMVEMGIVFNISSKINS